MLEWQYRFAPVSLRDDAVLVEARVLAGGCGGAELSAYRFALGERTGTEPAPLDEGTYGLSVRARDRSCAWFAEGCVAVQVPSDEGAVTVVLEARTPEVDCLSCVDGRCADE